MFLECHLLDGKTTVLFICTPTITISHRANPARALTAFAHEPLQNMCSVSSMSARLTDDNGFLDGVYEKCQIVSNVTRCRCKTALPLYCEFTRSISRVASGMIPNVIKQTEHLGRARLQLGHAVG